MRRLRNGQSIRAGDAAGELVALPHEEEVAIRCSDALIGEVVVQFPRIGYGVKAA